MLKTVTKKSFVEYRLKTTNTSLIESVSEYIKYVEFLRNSFMPDIWFRGISRSSYKLVPSIYRNNVWNYNKSGAQDITNSFIHKAKIYYSNKSRISKWEWYHLMQHYGVPTRLLDWTEGYLIALFFAVRNLSSVSIPSVWCINPFELNNFSSGEVVYFTDPITRDEEDNEIVDKYLSDDSADLPKYPIAIQPPCINERIASQRSCFTVNGVFRDAFSKIHADSKSKFQLVQLRISTSFAEKIKDEIVNAGINEATLFPDLEGLARELKYEFGME